MYTYNKREVARITVGKSSFRIFISRFRWLLFRRLFCESTHNSSYILNNKEMETKKIRVESEIYDKTPLSYPMFIHPHGITSPLTWHSVQAKIQIRKPFFIKLQVDVFNVWARDNKFRYMLTLKTWVKINSYYNYWYRFLKRAYINFLPCTLILHK